MSGDLRRTSIKTLSLMQNVDGSAERCQTCLFPTYPHISAVDLAAYEYMDFSNQWVYFLGDLTVRQMYGEFAAILHRMQVSSSVFIFTSLGVDARKCPGTAAQGCQTRTIVQHGRSHHDAFSSNQNDV